MTNQNVVVSDGKSSMKVAVAMAMSNSSLFSPALPKPPTSSAGRYMRRKAVKKLETQGGPPKINAWVDSMRASSPAKSPPSSPEHDSWMVLTYITHKVSFNLIFIDITKSKVTVS